MAEIDWSVKPSTVGIQDCEVGRAFRQRTRGTIQTNNRRPASPLPRYDFLMRLSDESLRIPQK